MPSKRTVLHGLATVLTGSLLATTPAAASASSQQGTAPIDSAVSVQANQRAIRLLDQPEQVAPYINQLQDAVPSLSLTDCTGVQSVGAVRSDFTTEGLLTASGSFDAAVSDDVAAVDAVQTTETPHETVYELPAEQLAATITANSVVVAHNKSTEEARTQVTANAAGTPAQTQQYRSHLTGSAVRRLRPHLAGDLVVTASLGPVVRSAVVEEAKALAGSLETIVEITEAIGLSVSPTPTETTLTYAIVAQPTELAAVSVEDVVTSLSLSDDMEQTLSVTQSDAVATVSVTIPTAEFVQQHLRSVQ